MLGRKGGSAKVFALLRHITAFFLKRRGVVNNKSIWIEHMWPWRLSGSALHIHSEMVYTAVYYEVKEMGR